MLRCCHAAFCCCDRCLTPGVVAIAVKILRGSYAPLSSEYYSAELHHLVAALLRRKPDHRPSMDEARGHDIPDPDLCDSRLGPASDLPTRLPLSAAPLAQVLSMDYVRQHLRRYRDHVQQVVERRKQSYFHSLDAFHLDSSAADVAAALQLDMHGEGGAQHSRPPRSQSGAHQRLGTFVINASSTEQAPGADLGCALALASSAAAAPLGSRARPPKHTTFSAAMASGQQGAAWQQRSSGSTAERLAAVAAAAKHIQQQPEQQEQGGLGERRYRASFGTTDSPQSHFFDTSLDTTSTSIHSASGAVGGDALPSSQLPGATEQDGVEEVAASRPSPNHVDSAAAVIAASADAVGELVRRAPRLLGQVQQMLAGPLGVDEGQEGREERRLSRRAAVQECQEELFTKLPALPPPAFSAYPR